MQVVKKVKHVAYEFFFYQGFLFTGSDDSQDSMGREETWNMEYETWNRTFIATMKIRISNSSFLVVLVQIKTKNYNTK